MDKGVVYLEKRLLGGEVRVPGTECLLKSMVSEKTAERNNRKKEKGRERDQEEQALESAGQIWSSNCRYHLTNYIDTSGRYFN